MFFDMENLKQFLTADTIDLAIKTINYDLLGSRHPLGFRHNYMESIKAFDADIWNFIAFMYLEKEEVEDSKSKQRLSERSFMDDKKLSFDDWVLVCQEIKSVCDSSQIETINLIVKEILSQHETFLKEIEEGKREKSPYIKEFCGNPSTEPYMKNKILLALKKVFIEEKEPTHHDISTCPICSQGFGVEECCPFCD